MDNGAGQLRRERDQECFLVLTELAYLALAHHQHTEHLAMLDNRYAKEPVVGMLAGLVDEAVAVVARCVLDIHRFLALADHTDQAFVMTQLHLADRILAQTLGRAQYEILPGLVQQVDRRHVHPDR